MQIESNIYIHKEPAEVYATVKNIETYPRFMLNVEDIRVIDFDAGKRMSEWKVTVNETPLIWQQEDSFSDNDYKIDFKCLKGDLAHFEGFWKIQQENGLSKLSFCITLDWTGALAIRYNNEFINRKAQAVIKAMLRAFKRRLESGIEAVKGDTIVSEVITYKNREGKNIVGFFDHLRIWSKYTPFIILPPGYGETKRDTLSTSYYLVKNGFNCLRYDATDHVGESDGEVVNATLPKLKKDLLSTIDYIQHRFGANKVTVVATSLANRTALKAASEDRRIHFLVGLVGVVNVQETLKSIYKEDMVSAFLKGERWGPTDIFGLKVSFENFLEAAVKDGFHTLESTLNDVSKLDIPIVFLVAENDIWVRAEEVQLVFEKTKGKIKEFHIIPDVMHKLQENPKAARLVMKQIVASCMKYALNKLIDIDQIIEPNMREIAVQSRLEKERLRLRDIFTLSSERDFWGEYLVSFSIIYKVPEYKEYLTLLYELIGGMKDGDYVLDAGCGVGYFGAWLINEIIKANRSAKKNFNLYSQSYYYAVDFVQSALHTARIQHESIKNMFLQDMGHSDKFNTFFPAKYEECDLNFDLPYEDSQFDKICCSLVLSYLTEPLLTTRELLRVLKPGGSLVISSLKPFSDLSEIYRKFITIGKTEQDIIEARRLLSEVGRIKQKEEMGHYRFFSERELKFLLLAAGGKRVKVYRSLGNQANIAVAVKEK